MLSCNAGPLEWLLQESGGNYMSDLRSDARGPSMTVRLREALRQVPADAWAPGQWADVTSYLTGERRNFSSQEECITWILAHLEKT